MQAYLSKRIAILGSTGSIGCNALDVIAHLGYRAAALSGNRNLDKLIDQVHQFKPAAVGIAHDSLSSNEKSALAQDGASLYYGSSGLCEMVSRDDIDQVLAAIVGAAGLPPVLAAVRAGKDVALANKESLVIAGSLLMPEARKRRVNLLPVDSEHSAVFQAMQCGKLSEIKRVILTASGGPFRTWSADSIEKATVQDALNHPTWQMGSKITIDSATMFNKALEIIEAVWLFDLPASKIEVVIHPESIVHSMVEFEDGNVIAQLSPPDMRTPIQYAFTYPQRLPGVSRKLDVNRGFALNFEPPDLKRFPALRLAYWAAEQKGTAGTVLNAANETAVEAFLSGKIGFCAICHTVEAVLEKHKLQSEPNLDDLLEADRWARRSAAEIIGLSKE